MGPFPWRGLWAISTRHVYRVLATLTANSMVLAWSLLSVPFLPLAKSQGLKATEQLSNALLENSWKTFRSPEFAIEKSR